MPQADGEAEAARPAHAASLAAEQSRVAGRFRSLGSAFDQQVRDPRWARAREQELQLLNTQSDYMHGTTFDQVECRSSWCKMVASHATETDQSNFREVLPGLVPQLPWASIHAADEGDKLRTEVYFSSTGPLPR
jgi:hypothetical protein